MPKWTSWLIFFEFNTVSDGYWAELVFEDEKLTKETAS